MSVNCEWQNHKTRKEECAPSTQEYKLRTVKQNRRSGVSAKHMAYKKAYRTYFCKFIMHHKKRRSLKKTKY